MELLIPEYALDGNRIVAVRGRPVRVLSPYGEFFGHPRERTPGFRLRPAVSAFLDTDASDPRAVLAFSNTYGALGTGAWDPSTGFRPPDEPCTQAPDWLPYVNHLRLLHIFAARPKVPPSTPITDVEAAVNWEPSLLTLSLWVPQDLYGWRLALARFASVFFLFRSAMVLPIRLHGLRRATATLPPSFFRDELEALRLAILRLLEGEVPSRLEQTLSPGTPPDAEAMRERIVLGLALAWRASNTWLCVSGPALRPRPDLAGWMWNADPPCLLSLLYMSLFTSLLGDAPHLCPLPGCTDFVAPNRRFCCPKHANVYRQRKHQAKGAHDLTDEEVQAMEELVAGEGMNHLQAAEQVAAQRTSPPRGDTGDANRPGRTSRPSRRNQRQPGVPR